MFAEPAAVDEPVDERWLAGCDYIPDPGAVDKLAFYEGDVLTITLKDDGGWWFASLGNGEGWVPSDFMDPLEDDTCDYDKGLSELPPQEMVDDDMASALAALDNANQALARHTSVSEGREPAGLPKPIGELAPHLAESYEDMSDAFSPKRPMAEPYEVMHLGEM